jgi:hypothetical protein
VSGIKTMEDHFHTVGLPDAAVRESRDRVRAALKNCGYDILPPTSRSTLLRRIFAKRAPASTCLLHRPVGGGTTAIISPPPSVEKLELGREPVFILPRLVPLVGRNR